MKKDPLIQYFRQEKNREPAADYGFVFTQATGEYFMGVSDDDEWDADFMKACSGFLFQHRRRGMAFCTSVPTDSFGRITRKFPSFEHLSHPASRKKTACYPESPEFFGRSDLLYGLYRMILCRGADEACPLTDQRGGNIRIVLAALERGGVCIDNRVHLKKRIWATDNPGHIVMNAAGGYDTGTLNFLYSCSSIGNNLQAVRETLWYRLAPCIILKRLPVSFLQFCLSPFHGMSRKKSGKTV